jgi:hypothetical protein
VDAGKSYVVFGKANGTAVNLSDIAAGHGGFVINGQTSFSGSLFAPYGDGSGTSVSNAGDVNGDGLDDLLVGAPYGDPGPPQYGGSAFGKSYVVFGKADGEAVNLWHVAAGQGGFVIKGEAAADVSGTSVSAAGDVNGDGFADLLVGAIGADPSHLQLYSYAGKSYVIFGGASTYTSSIVDFLGDSGNNILTGTSANEQFIGGAGNDTLIGGGGKDVMYGGAGSDTFVLNTSNVSHLADNSNNSSSIMRIDGGTGVDTLQLSGGASLDLTGATTLSRVQSIEKFDLATDASANSLTLHLNEVLELSGMNLINAASKAGLGWTGGTYTFGATESRHQMIVDGGSNDNVFTTGGFTDSGLTAIINGHTYEVYNQGSYAQLLIETAMNRAGVH